MWTIATTRPATMALSCILAGVVKSRRLPDFTALELQVSIVALEQFQKESPGIFRVARPRRIGETRVGHIRRGYVCLGFPPPFHYLPLVVDERPKAEGYKLAAIGKLREEILAAHAELKTQLVEVASGRSGEFRYDLGAVPLDALSPAEIAEIQALAEKVVERR